MGVRKIFWIIALAQYVTFCFSCADDQNKEDLNMDKGETTEVSKDEEDGDDDATLIVGAEGGTVLPGAESGLLGATAEIPANALEKDTSFTITEAKTFENLPEGILMAGKAVRFGPDNLTFLKPVTLKLPFDPKILSQNEVSEKGILLFSHRSDRWEEVQGFTVDTENDQIVVEVNHLSLFTTGFLKKGAKVSLNLEAVSNITIAEGDNPEDVAVIPGSEQAIFVSSSAKKIGLLSYGETSFELEKSYAYFKEEAIGNSEMTSLDLHPDGSYFAVTRTILTGGDCTGSIVFIDLENGEILHEVNVGKCPDSVSFSPDGRFLAVANENDREKYVNKPEDAKGGSVSVLDLSQGLKKITLIKEIMVDHDLDSEPEGIKIGQDNDTVAFPVQETSEVGIFKISELMDENFSVTYVTLPEDSEPDGIAIDTNLGIAVIGNEKGDSFSIVSLDTKKPVVTKKITDDLPATFGKDKKKATEQVEPEGIWLFKKYGIPFVIIALQESAALVVYNLSDFENPLFDSAAKAGILDESQNEEKSKIGPEGIDFSPISGIGFSANEREGTVTMYKFTPTVSE